MLLPSYLSETTVNPIKLLTREIKLRPDPPPGLPAPFTYVNSKIDNYPRLLLCSEVAVDPHYLLFQGQCLTQIKTTFQCNVLISLAYVIRTLLARFESILVMSENKIIINILVISKMVAEGELDKPCIPIFMRTSA